MIEKRLKCEQKLREVGIVRMSPPKTSERRINIVLQRKPDFWH